MHKFTLRRAVAGLGLLVLATFSHAATYNFYQAGYSGGGGVSGYFSGTDLNGDGYLVGTHGEIDGFQLSFAGNAAVDAFSIDYADFLQTVSIGWGLIYRLGSTTLGTELNGLSDGMLMVFNFDAYGNPLDSVSAVPIANNFSAAAAGPGTLGIASTSIFGTASDANGNIDMAFAPMTLSLQSVPEPGSLALTALAGAALLARRRR
ncbi:PEP-CTERM sorting domain-containing protein [Zoogloea sp. LCSB751]|uniref:PEP-CTERM sorting domain-containing protein n=1 Tax=Zoogloea sp. LCSB751 TaxID=1965277 RepID=UPI0009A498E8|nr:PEP-CTERM sorting domain-containing protein [Zoogloea sp. LCSB751]